MGNQYSAPHLKTHARNIEHRCSLLTNKRNNEIRQSKKKVAKLLKEQKDESARFEMLQIIRYEKFLVAYKLFVLAGRLVTDSVGVISASQLCPAELLDACSTIIFGADRFIDINELKACSEQFFLKWGEDFVGAFRVNRDGRVNPQLVKACVQPNPIKDDTIKYLKYLAKEHGVSWEPKEDFGPESLGCMKAFPLGYLDDGSTDITIPEDEPAPQPVESSEEEEGELNPPDAGDSLPPPQYEEPQPPPAEPQQPRGPHYYFEPEKPAAPQIPANAHLYQQPAPTPAPKPTPAPQPQTPRVAAYPAIAPQPVPQQSPRVAAYPAAVAQTTVAAYPAAAPQPTGPIAAYPAASPSHAPVAAYPAASPTHSTPAQSPQHHQQQQQQQQQPQPQAHVQVQAQVADNSLEARLARLQGK